jgi:hypothetical protein
VVHKKKCNKKKKHKRSAQAAKQCKKKKKHSRRFRFAMPPSHASSWPDAARTFRLER